MTFEIDDAETEALIRELSARMGEPIDTAIKIAAEERLQRLIADTQRTDRTTANPVDPDARSNKARST
ncbi:type II toxin-antitoxin system VapB family antitoxin [Bosea sp. Root381]|uniref:type II toxin-antitoxin system VapB family antitoxin n=1 Tax=Bosea sp. Root381 TaxID=1736524 RepID=UPI00138F5B99|nr:type II toxin-antitoxin system VapB family antitoxin [Bosea sp. Root381]